MITKENMFYLKVAAATSVVGSIYLMYKTKDYYYVFFISVFVLFSLLILDYILDRVLQEYSHLQKKRIAIEQIASWRDEDELTELKEQLVESKNLYYKTVDALSNKLKQHEEILVKLMSKPKSDKELEGKNIDKPIGLTLDKAVGWNEKDTELSKMLLEGNIIATENYLINPEIDKIIKEENIDKYYIDLLKEQNPKDLDEFLELYNLAKKHNMGIEAKRLIHGLFINENETLRQVLVKKYQEEKGIDVNKFLTYVRILAETDEPFEYEGNLLERVVFVKGSCVYVNFYVFKKFFKDYTDDMEETYAKIFGNYLCPQIDWRKGYIKRSFKIKYNNKDIKAPFLAIKKSAVSDELKETEGVSMVSV